MHAKSQLRLHSRNCSANGDTNLRSIRHDCASACARPAIASGAILLN
jgi:hypothetical protein